MIHEVTGDILLTKAEALAHGVAPNDDFRNGLALALRERWPAMYKDFRHYCQTRHPAPGETWTWAGPRTPRIVNLFTQEGAVGRHGGKPGRAHVNHVAHALRALRQLAEHEKFASLALPRLATGVGGLDWADVQPLVQRHLGDLKIPVILYTVFHSGAEAREPG